MLGRGGKIVVVADHECSGGATETPLLSSTCSVLYIELHLSTGGKSVIKSIEQLAKGQVDFAPSGGMKAGFVRFLSILNCWHVPHPWM